MGESGSESEICAFGASARKTVGISPNPAHRIVGMPPTQIADARQRQQYRGNMLLVYSHFLEKHRNHRVETS